MPLIKNRVYYTSTNTISPFTVTPVAGYEQATGSEVAYYTIEQKSDKSIFARVSAYANGNSLEVRTVEYTTAEADGVVDTDTKQLPTFTGTVNIYTTLPLTKMQRGDGQDGILIVGDGNAVGLNGIGYHVSDVGGWSHIMDFPDPRVLQYRKNGKTTNADHTALGTNNADVTNKVVLAQEPLCHSFNVGNFPDPNSVGFGISFGKEYTHNHPGARQAVLIPVGDSTQGFDASFDGTTRNSSIAISGEFLGLNTGNIISAIIICMGSVDAETMTNGVFTTKMTELIDYYRAPARYPTTPIVVVGLPNTHTGGQTTNVRTAIADLPNSRFGVGYAEVGSLGASDAATGKYLNGPAQRALGKVIYKAFVAATENVKLT